MRNLKLPKIVAVFACIMFMLLLMSWDPGSVLAAEPKPAKLPAGGGEPGKAYMSFVKAILNKDVAGVRKWHALAAKVTDDKEIKEGIEFMALTASKNTKISGGIATSDKATIYVSFVSGKEKQYGEIELIKGSSNWQLVKESWSNQPHEKK